MQKDELFAKVQDGLKTKISDFNYKNWFQNLKWDLEGDNKVVIKVPSKFVRDWLQDHYLELIKFELFRHGNFEFSIAFKVEKTNTENLNLFEDTKVETKPAPIAPKAFQPKTKLPQGFNPDYTFESFVVGNSNQLVNAASQAVANHPGKNYNPFFIYGGVGLGKTHLLNAIGIEIHKNNPSWKIISVTGEQFTNEVINAIRFDKTFDLRKKYRECDVLLIDDIQFIAGKERTMEEFFHTFNALYEARKQVVITSDKLPKDIMGLEERLRSRFSWGLLADIQNPDFETRVAILQRKAERDATVVTQDVLEFIAKHVTSNVRELEGALIRLFAFASLAKTKITVELANQVLHQIVATARPQNSVESIQKTVCDYYKLTLSDLTSKRRHKNLATPRQIAMYLCKKHLRASFPEIGSKFGGKDHTTVMHAVQKIGKVSATDLNLSQELSQLENLLGI